MGRARCTLKVQGLDCPAEVAALTGGPGAESRACSALGFDLIHGTMTVDYDPDATDPDRLARLRGRSRGDAGRGWWASPRSGARWWERNGRWASTAGSGLALLVGGPDRLLRRAGRVGDGWPSAWRSRPAGLELFPRAVRGLRRLRLDIHVLMGLAIAGAMALGQWDEAATVAFLFGLSEALEALSLDRARRAVRGLAGDRARDRRA